MSKQDYAKTTKPISINLMVELSNAGRVKFGEYSVYIFLFFKDEGFIFSALLFSGEVFEGPL